MVKLTLSVEDNVVQQAKEYAKLHGVSVSKMVQDYLSALTAPAKSPQADPPVLRALRGVLKGVDIGDYRDYVAERYK